MKMQNFGIAAAVAMLAAGTTGTAVIADPGNKSPGSSAASISLSDCVIVSSKEISNIEFFANGATVAKDESVNTSSFDLTTVEGIESIDTVAVKAGTSVETFAVDCAPDAAPGGDGGTPDEGGSDDGSGGDGAQAAQGNSAATITLSDCLVVSSKEISNIEFFADGTPVNKDESISASSFDLTTVEGIESITTVTVKAGTTAETFNVACAPGTPPADGSADGGSQDEDAPEDDNTEGDSAVITLSGCVLSSTKDISNIEFYSGGALVAKDESMNDTSFDLTTVEGIENIDTVTVKSSTTVETFAVSCAPAAAADGSDKDDTEMSS